MGIYMAKTGRRSPQQRPGPKMALPPPGPGALVAACAAQDPRPVPGARRPGSWELGAGPVPGSRGLVHLVARAGDRGPCPAAWELGPCLVHLGAGAWCPAARSLVILAKMVTSPW